jgi:hypothetical protein
MTRIQRSHDTICLMLLLSLIQPILKHANPLLYCDGTKGITGAHKFLVGGTEIIDHAHCSVLSV